MFLQVFIDFWGFCSPARKWLAPVAVGPIGVHDQLYKKKAVESQLKILRNKEAPSAVYSVEAD
jgi:hypothetical protein